MRHRYHIDRILMCEDPVGALELLRTTCAMQAVIPELCRTFEMTQNQYHFGTVWEHTLRVVEQTPPSLTLRMAALLHDIGKIETRSINEVGKVQFIGHDIASARIAHRILRRLGYDNDFITEVCFLVRHHMVLKPYGERGEKLKAKKLRQLQHICGDRYRFENLMALIHADNCSHADPYCMPQQVPAVHKRSRKMELEGSTMFDYRLPLTAKEVMQLKNISKGAILNECIDYLWKLASVNPLRPREEFVKHLIGYHINSSI